MRRLLGVGLVIAVTTAACSGSAADSWADIEPTLTRGLDETSSNTCVRGDPECVDIVLAEMTDRLAPLEDDCDHDAAFALMYLEMTRRVAADLSAGTFEDLQFLAHLDAVFADFYFDAFDRWHAGDRDAVPAAWRIAFDAADGRDVAGIGNLLLGANAHIRRDLAFVMEAVGVDAVDGTSRRPDYDEINPIIEDLARPLLSEIAARLDPSIALLDLPLISTDERTAGEILAAWRTEAFDDAVRLLDAGSPAERDTIAAEIDAKAEATARLIRDLTAYPPFLGAATVRDGICRAAR